MAAMRTGMPPASNWSPEWRERGSGWLPMRMVADHSGDWTRQPRTARRRLGLSSRRSLTSERSERWVELGRSGTRRWVMESMIQPEVPTGSPEEKVRGSGESAKRKAAEELSGATLERAKGHERGEMVMEENWAAAAAREEAGRPGHGGGADAGVGRELAGRGGAA